MEVGQSGHAKHERGLWSALNRVSVALPQKRSRDSLLFFDLFVACALHSTQPAYCGGQPRQHISCNDAGVPNILTCHFPCERVEIGAADGGIEWLQSLCEQAHNRAG
jgi:hypothetical protein